MITAVTEVRVRFAETDAMGVVYHANYFPWCECARLNLIETMGLTYKKMIEDGYHLPVVEAHLNYKFPARYDDIISIKAFIKERPAVRVKVEYEISANGKLLATGHTVHVFVNKDGAPVKPPKDVLAAMLKSYEKK